MKKRLDLRGSKKGATSFYVVIFATLLLSVVVMSFVRIMLSGATKTTNTDLSNSAYDSALAGIEDAKIALARYHKCLDEKGANPNPNAAKGSCEYLVWSMQQNDCDSVGRALGRVGKSGGEVILKASSNSSNSESMEQAYTCVKITNDVSDYRAKVDSGHRVHVVPIRVEDANEIDSLDFKWSYDPYANRKDLTIDDYKDTKLPRTAAADKTSPVMVDIYQTDESFKIGELSLNSENGTDHASLLLVPQKNQALTMVKTISSADVLKASDKADNTPFPVNCNNTDGFDCSVNIGVPRPHNGENRNGGTFLVRVEAPYGEPINFSITAKDSNVTKKFKGVQAQIDSTGRANDLFRRIDARVDLIDDYFPYPEFAASITGSGHTSRVDKTSWVTQNCWSSDSETDDGNGSQKANIKACDNIGTSRNSNYGDSDNVEDYDEELDVIEDTSDEDSEDFDDGWDYDYADD